MISIQLEDLIRLQEISISKSGGEYGIRDKGLLESAYYAPLASFGGIEAFLTAIEKISRLTWGLILIIPSLMEIRESELLQCLYY